MRTLAGIFGLAALAGAAFGGSALVAPVPAAAQSAVCQKFGELMQQRQAIVQRIQRLGTRNVDPRQACTIFGSLISNGTQGMAFIAENKDWCQIPDQFVEQFEADHKRTGSIRAQACRAAAQRTALERQARQQQQQQQQGQGAFGGPDGFTGGPWRVPQGAL